jgi:hypothetical protein
MPNGGAIREPAYRAGEYSLANAALHLYSG